MSGAAEFQSALPAWLATTYTVPGPVQDKVLLPVMVAGPAAMLNETGNPDEACAVKSTESPLVWLPMAEKLVMLWARNGCGLVNCHASTS